MREVVVSPGPLMDAKIARTLWRALVIHEAETGESYLMGEDGHKVALPRFSTEVDDAHQVVEFMKANGWTLSLKHESEGGDHWVALFGKPDGKSYRYIRAETMPLVICLAALWALSGTNIRTPQG